MEETVSLLIAINTKLRKEMVNAENVFKAKLLIQAAQYVLTQPVHQA